MMTIKEYKKAESLEEAWQLNQKKSNRVIGGMLWLKMGSGMVQTAIDLSGLGLDQIEETENEFRIGCMVTLRELEEHAGLEAYTKGAMKESLRHIVGVQFRNLATVGGSIYGRFGFSDVLTMLLAMDSYVELYKGGIRPLKEYASETHDRDILMRIIVKKAKCEYFYQSVRNSRTDFPVLTCAASRSEDGVWLFAIGARPGRAVLLTDNQKLLAEAEKGTNEAAVEAFASYARKQVHTGSNLRGSGEYRTHLTGVLAARAIRALVDRVDGEQGQKG